MIAQALLCDACGSRDLVRVDAERYRCSHCGASVVLASRSTSSLVIPAANAKLATRGWLFGVAGLALAAVFAIVLWQITTSRRIVREQTIDPATVVLTAATPVVAIDRPTHRDKLLVMVSNRGKQPIGAPRVVASFFDGSTKLDTASDFAQTGVLLPGETAPALIDLPPRSGTRSELSVAAPLRAITVASGPVLAFAQMRLVQRDGRYKLAARVQAPPGRNAMSSCRASIVLLDGAGATVAIGDGRCRARDVAPGESTLVDASFVRIGAAPVASWRYHIDYELAQPSPAPLLQIASASRQHTVDGGAETIASTQSWDAVDLLRPR